MIVKKGFLVPVLTLTLLLSCLTIAGNAQEYVPSVGQDGKDVIWVPTPEELITSMLDMAKVSSSDYVIDLGSGDGRIVIAAAKRGAHALGIEYNPDMVELSKRNAQKEGVTDKATFIRGDIFESDFSKATVITMYLLPDLNLKLRPKILEMKPGTRVVSHAFSMGDWEADQTANVEERTAYFWIVPAKVAGAWAWQNGSGTAELTLSQSYQKIEGSLKSDGKELPIQNAKLEGDRISFEVPEGNPTLREYSGRVSGNTIEGSTKVPGAPEARWTAARRTSR
jgi:SAM-dependent methyltransferase